MYSCKGNSYAYYLGKEEDRQIWKIYQPLESRERKWFTNANKHHVQGHAQLPRTGDGLFITSSHKDIIALRKLGFFAIAPSSESTPLDEGLIEEYKERFGHLTLFYDNDEQGIKSAAKHAELYGCKSMTVPIMSQTKDPSDFVEKNGYDELKKVIQYERRENRD